MFSWKQPKYQSTGSQVNQLCSIHAMKCYLTIESASWLHPTTRMKLTDITLSERSWHRRTPGSLTSFTPSSRTGKLGDRGRNRGHFQEWGGEGGMMGWTTRELPKAEKFYILIWRYMHGVHIWKSHPATVHLRFVQQKWKQWQLTTWGQLTKTLAQAKIPNIPSPGQELRPNYMHGQPWAHRCRKVYDLPGKNNLYWKAGSLSWQIRKRFIP